MHLSVRIKLFLILFATGLLVIVSTQAFVHWSFQHGLETMAAERRAQRIERIAERLIGIYANDGSWDRLRENRRLWLAALFGQGPRGIDDEAREAEDQARERLHPGRRGPVPPWLLRRFAASDEWPPKWASMRHEHHDRPPPLELRLMLLDADGGILYGRPELLPGAERHALQLDERTIGALALLPGASITELADLRFREQQRGQLWLIALAMATFSALLAIPLSSRLTRPVAAFQRTMRHLADGDYSARVHIARKDELGQLGDDLNALARALQQTEQARKRWVADISHELRTPLALLRADIEAMQDGVRPLNGAALGTLHADALRLGRLVDDLYELSMTDLGALSYRKQPLDIGALLAKELDAFRAQFEEAGLDLSLTHSDKGPWTITADDQRLSQLFRNLLRNSLAYTDRGGRLQVSLTRDAHGLHIVFEDSAPGVPPEALDKLFERLYRVESSRSRATGGAGLGLAIARNIVHAHGGRIVAEPSPLAGLRIRITLPPSTLAAEEPTS
jgi:two-component system sensor histidine kinase BaeS